MIRSIILVSISVLISTAITSFFFLSSVNSKLSELEQKTSAFPQIVAVDSSELFKDFVLNIQSSIEEKRGLNNQEAENLIQQKISTHKIAVDLFNEEIVKIAKNNNLIILDKGSIISGVRDETPKAKKLLNQLMGSVKDE